MKDPRSYSWRAIWCTATDAEAVVCAVAVSVEGEDAAVRAAMAAPPASARWSVTERKKREEDTMMRGLTSRHGGITVFGAITRASPPVPCCVVF